jgi:hypothetical protein
MAQYRSPCNLDTILKANFLTKAHWAHSKQMGIQGMLSLSIADVLLETADRLKHQGKFQQRWAAMKRYQYECQAIFDRPWIKPYLK